MTTRTCSQCGKAKAVSEFYLRSESGTIYRECKTCSLTRLKKFNQQYGRRRERPVPKAVDWEKIRRLLSAIARGEKL